MDIKKRRRKLQREQEFIIVSHKHKLIYCLVPKVACYSIRLALGYVREEDDRIAFRRTHTWNEAKQLKYPALAIGRHPAARLVSWYCHIRQNIIGVDFQYKILQPLGIQDTDCPFAVFAKAVCSLLHDSKFNIHGQQQSVLLPPLEQIDYFCLLEDLPQTWKTIQTKHGLLDLTHDHSTIHDHFSTYFTPELAEMVTTAYAPDFELLNLSTDFEDWKTCRSI